MKQNAAAQYIKWLLMTLVLVCSIFVPISTKTAKAEKVARAGYANGFNEQFTNWSPNWYIDNGTWKSGRGLMSGEGVFYGWSGVYFNQSIYRNFDYTARMVRKGCATCANTVYFRDTGSSRVQFSYTNSGSFGVYAQVNGRDYTWISWTKSWVISRNGYNILRVVALNNNYYFFINNYLVATKVVPGPTTASGFVGVEFYSGGFDWPLPESLHVDYAGLIRK